MIKPPDERIHKALKRIQQYPEWKIIEEWIANSMIEALNKTTLSDNDLEIKRLQGRALELAEIIDYVKNSQKAIERYDRK